MPKAKSKRNPNAKTAQRTIPYVPGFRPPTLLERKAAIANKISELGFLVPAYENNGWKPLPKCSSEDDWLAQYAEQGQTLNQFLGKY